MNRNVTLIGSSFLSLILLIVHVSDDVVRGIDKIGPANLIGVSIFVLWLYGTLTLGGRRSGYVIMLLGSLFGAAIAMFHMVNGVSRTLANTPNGALLFVFTLWALAVTATFSVVLSARGLWRREWARDEDESAPGHHQQGPAGAGAAPAGMTSQKQNPSRETLSPSRTARTEENIGPPQQNV